MNEFHEVVLWLTPPDGGNRRRRVWHVSAASLEKAQAEAIKDALGLGYVKAEPEAQP